MKGRTINTADLHDVVMQRKKEYGKLADLIDSTVEEMVAATPTTDRTVQDFVDKCRECGRQKKGKWIDTKEICTNVRGQIVHEVICSECNGLSYFRSMGNKYIGANLCPNCGSKNEAENPTGSKKVTEIHCNLTGAEIAQSFIDDVMAVEDLLPRGETEGEE